MYLPKRNFLKLGAIAGGAVGLSHAGSSEANLAVKNAPKLASIIDDAKPISIAERRARTAKAQTLMTNHKIDAILLEPGSAMNYFTGINWWRSERLTAVVIPREGDIAVVTPEFEEPSVRESMAFGDDVRTWNEHQDPFQRVFGVLKDRGIKSGRIGLESTVRYFVVKGLGNLTSDLSITSALPITKGCRMYKSPAEISLMYKANEVTLTAYQHVYQRLADGMPAAEVKAMMRSAQSALGGKDIWNMVLCGPASAYPHGTKQLQEVREGGIVLMDCGCSVHGYQSDISRTFVFGEANQHQKEVWNTVRNGQQIAYETAQIGAPAGKVDDAVRAYYEKLGYGPGYATPGLSHRTGHGIGMDGHERVNFVHGEDTKLAAGMCFSNEPGIYIFGKFGVRLEDCLYMTNKGPHWFTEPPASLDNPIGRLATV